MKKLLMSLAIALSALPAFSADTAAEPPPVKKSKTGICHAKGSHYYAQTKYFTPFQTMEECIKSGGRPPKK